MDSKIVIGIFLFAGVIGGFVLFYKDEGNSISSNTTQELLNKESKIAEKKKAEADKKQATELNAKINAPAAGDDDTEVGIKTTFEGTGDRAVAKGDKISVNYVGKFVDGKIFDATSQHGGQPFEFTVGAGVIEGWSVGVLGMRVGEKRTLTIPADWGYGEKGVPGVIAPNTALIFDIELVAFK